MDPKSDFYEWIVFDDGTRGKQIGTTLTQLFPHVSPIYVVPGNSFEKLSDNTFAIDPTSI